MIRVVGSHPFGKVGQDLGFPVGVIPVEDVLASLPDQPQIEPQVVDGADLQPQNLFRTD